MEDIDIWRTAAEMLRQYGDEPALTAGMRADALLERGDIDGFHVWKRVVVAISELERKGPIAGERLN